MAEAVLLAEKREALGKAEVHRLRRQDKVPGVMYSEGKEATPIFVDRHDFEMSLREDHSIVSLKVKNKKHQVIVREIQYHPVKGHILHVDFMGIRKGQKVEMSVPLHFEGEAAGSNDGGIFSSYKTEVYISALPKDLPDYIDVEVSHLEMGDSLRIKDIVKENVEFLDDPEDVVCMVEYPMREEEEVVEEEEEEAAEPEVITSREKDEEEEEEKE